MWQLPPAQRSHITFMILSILSVCGSTRCHVMWKWAGGKNLHHLLISVKQPAEKLEWPVNGGEGNGQWNDAVSGLTPCNSNLKVTAVMTLPTMHSDVKASGWCSLSESWPNSSKGEGETEMKAPSRGCYCPPGVKVKHTVGPKRTIWTKSQSQHWYSLKNPSSR